MMEVTIIFLGPGDLHLSLLTMILRDADQEHVPVLVQHLLRLLIRETMPLI
jgi:hypothetical protein